MNRQFSLYPLLFRCLAFFALTSRIAQRVGTKISMIEETTDSLIAWVTSNETPCTLIPVEFDIPAFYRLETSGGTHPRDEVKQRSLLSTLYSKSRGPSRRQRTDERSALVAHLAQATTVPLVLLPRKKKSPLSLSLFLFLSRHDGEHCSRS